jgi:hypothetical protein
MDQVGRNWICMNSSSLFTAYLEEGKVFTHEPVHEVSGTMGRECAYFGWGHTHGEGDGARAKGFGVSRSYDRRARGDWSGTVSRWHCYFLDLVVSSQLGEGRGRTVEERAGSKDRLIPPMDLDRTPLLVWPFVWGSPGLGRTHWLGFLWSDPNGGKEGLGNEAVVVEETVTDVEINVLLILRRGGWGPELGIERKDLLYLNWNNVSFNSQRNLHSAHLTSESTH